MESYLSIQETPHEQVLSIEYLEAGVWRYRASRDLVPGAEYIYIYCSVYVHMYIYIYIPYVNTKKLMQIP